MVNGVADTSRVLDLSRAAMAFLLGVPASTLTDASVGVIDLDLIETAPPGATPGPTGAAP